MEKLAKYTAVIFTIYIIVGLIANIYNIKIAKHTLEELSKQ
jgi:hypothetical protein